MNSRNNLNASLPSDISSGSKSGRSTRRTQSGNNPENTIGLPSQPSFAGMRPSRVAALFLVFPAIALLLLGGGPHILYRAPLALLAAWGLWQSKTWAFTLSVVNAGVWLLVFFMVMPFLLIASPGELWLTWLYWLVSTGLVLISCIIMVMPSGRSERAAWKTNGDMKTEPPK